MFENSWANIIRYYTDDVRLRGLIRNQDFETHVGGETSAAGGFPSAGNWRTRRGFVCVAAISNRPFKHRVKLIPM